MMVTLLQVYRSPRISGLQNERPPPWAWSPPCEPLTVPRLLSLLPSLPVARSLLTFYVEDLSWVQHMIHVPTTYRELEVLYNKLSSCTKPDPSKLALIAAILSVAAFFWPGPLTGTAAHGNDNAQGHSQTWLMLVERVLEEANHLTCPTIEMMQAKLILLQFHPSYPRKTGRTGQIALLINQAHILRLHRMDSPRQCKARALVPEDPVKLEIQRRVWWTIVLTDWYATLSSWCSDLRW